MQTKQNEQPDIYTVKIFVDGFYRYSYNPDKDRGAFCAMIRYDNTGIILIDTASRAISGYRMKITGVIKSIEKIIETGIIKDKKAKILVYTNQNDICITANRYIEQGIMPWHNQDVYKRLGELIKEHNLDVKFVHVNITCPEYIFCRTVARRRAKNEDIPHEGWL